MKENKNNKSTPATSSGEQITRKEALGKLGNYGKYAALTALGTYLMLSPKKPKPLLHQIQEMDSK